MGSTARKFLHQLASAGCELTAEAFLTDALIRISVEWQRGNAFVLQDGMQQLRVEQSALAGGDKPIGGGAPQPASRRRQQRFFGARSADAQLDMSSTFHGSMRAGGGPTAARHFHHRRVTVEWSGA